MIEVNHSQLSMVRQCELESIAHSSYCFRPKPKSELNLELMRLIDELKVNDIKISMDGKGR
jgi:putative transposase